MADLDLKSALLMFQQGVQQYALSQTFSQANQAVRQIQDSAAKEEEKQAALRQVANKLVFSLGAQGVGADQANAYAERLTPKQKMPGSAEELLIQGLYGGDKKALEAGMAIKALTAKPKDLPIVPAGELDKLSELDSRIIEAQDFVNQVQKEGRLVGPIDARFGFTDPLFDRDFQAKKEAFKSSLGQAFDAYRKAITGAGAGEREIALLRENFPTMEDNDKTFIAKWQKVQQIVTRAKNTKLRNLQKAGYDVQQFSIGRDVQSMSGTKLPGINKDDFLESVNVLE